MQTLKAVLDIPAIGVFLGTLPLLGTICWGLLQNDTRLSRIETKLDSMIQSYRQSASAWR
jgi:hypothetical protein